MTTTLFDQAVEAVRRLPPESQDDIARAMLSMADGGEPEPIDPEHLEAVLEGLAQADRGEFVSNEKVAALLRSFDV
ncbi:hypothetical protein [Labrys wisconsinensis]|uniref:Uncharacterized protein n=1 Tax=Labrys wisconsinensis TaxID=425677 RepID=A0ABU0JDG2_9HYPH|nr:hypothetical protein [Labrys wisconsinensis]MDQ0472325.1 hypothetical protein [Labrys wisconsinensis]